MIGLEAADDAAAYRLDESRAVISTTDFFPPIVDDPYDFGAIAAANALSDVYAMGGKPLFAINLVAFPAGLNLAYLRAILQGGAEKVAEAGAVIAGGHSVNDKEPKYGLAVTGLADPRRLITKGGSQPGDLIVLTKPLGSGIITTALKNQQATAGHVEAAVASMKKLNRQAAEAALLCEVKSMTDITGFGLLGHAHEMAHLGHVNIRINSSRLSWLPGAFDYAETGNFPGGKANNQDYFARWVTFSEGISQETQDMLWTPETSGGLFAAVNPDNLLTFQQSCPSSVVIGEVFPGDGHIEVVTGDSTNPA